jgi:2-hydroxycyclohexanecarboxyl-CoA dehydrogenase
VRGLKNKTAIVTGGGQGIGRAIVLRLAEEGCNIALFDLKPDVAEETAKAAKGAEVRVYAADVSDRAAVDAAVAKVGSDLGPV